MCVDKSSILKKKKILPSESTIVGYAHTHARTQTHIRLLARSHARMHAQRPSSMNLTQPHKCNNNNTNEVEKKKTRASKDTFSKHLESILRNSKEAVT